MEGYGQSAATDRGARADVAPQSGATRLLLVSYHFGPGCATGGFRWNALVVGLAELGWQFDVITLARLPDPWNGETNPLPYGGEVVQVARAAWPDRAFDFAVRTKHWLFRDAARKARAAHASAGAEDVQVLGASQRSLYTRLMTNLSSARDAAGDLTWNARAVAAAQRLAKAHRYAAVIVSTPPHLMQRVGVTVSSKLGIPFIADLRDPWTFGLDEGLLSGTVDRWLGTSTEPGVFRNARVVVCNTEWARNAAAKSAGDQSGRFVAVPNGYDLQPQIAAPTRETFRVAFVGWLYAHMDPRPLLAACGRLRERARLGPGTLSVDFVGPAPNFGSVPLATLAAASGLGGCFKLHKAIPRDAALAFQQSAAVTTAFDYTHPLAVPMKFYDQVQMRGALLMIGNPEGALADAAAKLGIRVHAPEDSVGTDAALDAAYAKWQRNDYATPLDPDGVFDRRHTVGGMHAVLSRTVKASG